MKKLLALLLALMMVFALAACGENSDNPSGDTDNPGVSQTDNNGGDENLKGEDWQKYLTKYYGLKDVPAPGGTIDYKMDDTPTTFEQFNFKDLPADFDYEGFVQKLWDASKAVAKDGNMYKNAVLPDGEWYVYEVADPVAERSEVAANSYGSDNMEYDWFYICDDCTPVSSSVENIKEVMVSFVDGSLLITVKSHRSE